ncbi:MAG TPA: DUF5302 domain-containing protein [Streptosporangiaceae bacterium]|nr:DUF5302 domain-containing protein [Streptosporangiaceae bacterium]
MPDTGPEPERIENAEATEEPEATEEAEATEDPEALEDEAKRKFREALERKRTRETATGAGAGGPSAGKVQGVHGPASSRRSFRRRGGG